MREVGLLEKVPAIRLPSKALLLAAALLHPPAGRSQDPSVLSIRITIIVTMSIVQVQGPYFNGEPKSLPGLLNADSKLLCCDDA